MIKFSKANINQKLVSDVTNVIKSGWLTHGKFTERFENEIKKFIFKNLNDYLTLNLNHFSLINAISNKLMYG